MLVLLKHNGLKYFFLAAYLQVRQNAWQPESLSRQMIGPLLIQGVWES